MKKDIQIDWKNVLEERKPKGNPTAMYCIYYNNGEIKFTGNTACHYEMRSMSSERWHLKDALCLINFACTKLNMESHGKWIDYMLHRSPWAHCFLDDNAEDVIAHQAFVMDVDRSADLLAGACIHTRTLWEFRSDVDIWNELVSNGVGENLATLFANILQMDGHKYVFEDYGHGHRAMYPQGMLVEDVQYMLSPLEKSGIQPAFRECGKYVSPSGALYKDRKYTGGDMRKHVNGSEYRLDHVVSGLVNDRDKILGVVKEEKKEKDPERDSPFWHTYQQIRKYVGKTHRKPDHLAFSLKEAAGIIKHFANEYLGGQNA